jgi:hypothetical protein
MLKVWFCAKKVDGLTASRQISTSKKDSMKPPIVLLFRKMWVPTFWVPYVSFGVFVAWLTHTVQALLIG